MEITKMIAPGDVISYIEMCQHEGTSLQRGMNFHLKGHTNVVLMSMRKGSPYEDAVRDNGRTLIYEGHDISRNKGGSDPKTIDQPEKTPSGGPTQNALFFNAAVGTARGERAPELVRVYEKIRTGVWVFNGVFALLNAWQETSNRRKVFKFKLSLVEGASITEADHRVELPHNRLIPTSVKLEVWKRDNGKCVQCGSGANLHFDHIIPFSQGGSSLLAKNIQLLCAKHNLEKRDRIV